MATDCPQGRAWQRRKPDVSKGSSVEVTCFILETLTLSKGGMCSTWTRIDTVGLLWLLKTHGFHEHFSTAKKVSKLTRNKAALRQKSGMS